jgi:hypothetical protein
MENETSETNETNEQKIDQKKKIELIFLFVFSIIAAAVLASSAVYYFQTSKIEQIKRDYQQQIKILQAQKKQKPASPSVSVKNSIGTSEAQSADLPQLQIELNKIYVSWEKQPVEITENCQDGSRCFLVGKITNDDPKYKNKDFFLEASPTMGGLDMRHYIIEKGSDGADAKAYVEGEDEGSGAAIVGISDIPETITYPGTSSQLKKHYLPNTLFSDAKVKNKIFYDKNIGDFYTTEDGCIVAELPDHTAIAYNVEVPFVSDEDRVPDITFNGGVKNKDEYEYIHHTCGGVCTQLFEVKAEDLKPESSLEVVGKTSNGNDIFRYKDPNNQKLLDLYNDKNTMAYYNDNFEGQEKNKYSYDEFISSNPNLFWKDPLGRWVSFLNSKFTVAAEMCKPVIYLYPEKKTSLGLKLEIDGFLTHTDPFYEKGWKVEALPDGKIKNLNTGEYHNYLLWEGVGLNYPKQEEGWVVEKEDLNSFLGEKLSILGLNEKEIRDFKEYWLSRLNEKPFYKISFLSRKQFERLASVQFNPISPKVFIRVMMTAEGLDNYESIPEQILSHTPQRSGFTAVEWGGALLK